MIGTTNGAAQHGGHDEREPREGRAREPSPPSGSRENEKAPKLAEQVVQLVVLQADLFHDVRDVAHATVTVARSDGGVVERTMRLRSGLFRTWMARAARSASGQAVRKSTLDDALTALEGIACFDRPRREVHVRVAECDHKIYVDLGDETGRCIEVTQAGWHIVDRVQIRFVRPSGLLPLVVPCHGGSIEELRPFLNVNKDGFTLSVAWLVATYWPGRPCPGLAVTGEQGATKTTISKAARRLTDPNIADLRSPPRNEEDLLISACNSHVVALDNLSGLSPWLSDALCRLITGGGLGKRTLYRDEDETILQAIRPVLLNGIEDVAGRPDLAERCITLTLAPLAESKRRDEDSYWRAFDAAAPRILGALLDGVASALAGVDKVKRSRLPRMADFLKWTSAAEAGLGFPAGSIAKAYERNRMQVVAAALEASPVAGALRTLLERKGGAWQGTPTELLKALTQLVPHEIQYSQSWPKSPNHLTGRLRRAATALRQVGITVEEKHRGRGRDRKRWVTIRSARSKAPPVQKRTKHAKERDT